ncbi:MAG TPA: TraR/DksA family transcriptional regulator [Nitrosospira sp.]|nr:TraR/DksA family transcriptional regulator [Nitrosospira sp.]
MAELTDDQLAQLKTRLQDLYRTLREGVRTEIEDADGQHYEDLAGAVPDPGDSSVADVIVDTGAALTDKQVNELREVEAALKRLADLDYGDCEECGGEIGFERLMAYPTATRCIRCQEVHEKTYAHENKPTM